MLALTQGPKGVVQALAMSAAEQTPLGQELMARLQGMQEYVGEKIAAHMEGRGLDKTDADDKYLLGGGNLIGSILGTGISTVRMGKGDKVGGQGAEKTGGLETEKNSPDLTGQGRTEAVDSGYGGKLSGEYTAGTTTYNGKTVEGAGDFSGGLGSGKVEVGAKSSTLTGKNIDDLSSAGALLDPADKSGQLSLAGRALQKHGSREGSAFPSVKGSPSEINAQGQKIAQDILSNPASTITYKNTGRFGKVMDIVAPDGRGLRYDANGKFIGLLEPPRS